MDNRTHDHTGYELVVMHRQLGMLIDDLREFSDWNPGEDEILMKAQTLLGAMIDRGLR